MFQQITPDISISLFGLIFMEGLLAFLSPCILPMIPVYLLYLGGEQTEQKSRRLLINTLGFITGFTLVFVLLGATASALGGLLDRYRVLLQRLGGVVVLLFGLNYLGVFKLGFLNRGRGLTKAVKNLGFWSSILFGAAFSLGWTPCLGAFLGTAVILASNVDTLYQGMGLLLTFALGLGLPFLFTALLWDRLQRTFTVIKRNMNWISLVSGALLLIVGLLMIFDRFGRYVSLLQ